MYCEIQIYGNPLLFNWRGNACINNNGYIGLVPVCLDRCICGTAILYNYYLREPDSNGTQHIIMLGSQCIKRFVVNSVKNCSD